MRQNSRNIDVLVELLKIKKINKIVISPGGTNIPFVKAVQDDPFFTCYSIVDERSAIYFGIGLYLQTGEIIACSCTSAQATRNYIPGLTEAYYKRVPILAITMAKHPRFTYQEYMQAPDQTSLPNDCVKKSFALPYISDLNDEIHSIRLINEAIDTLKNKRLGPVQLCIPWLDFPLPEYSPIVKNVTRYTYEEPWNLELKNKSILLVIGEHVKFKESAVEAINKFSESYNVAIYSNHLSNFHNKYTVNANLLLLASRPQEFYKLAPKIIITIGGQTGDYPLYNMFSSPEFSNVEHWRVSLDGEMIDTYDKLTKVFECSEEYFFNNTCKDEKCEHNYYEQLSNAIANIQTDVKLPFSNASIALYLHNRIPQNSVIQFSILNSLRIWNLYDLDNSIECYSNVGAFGIDGGMSTLIGQSIINDNLCFMIIGDLAFYYDMNSIGIRHIKNNLRILLINNNGGIEFKFGKSNNEKMDKYIAAGNHFKNAKGWAETCGFRYMSANTMEEFEEQAKDFIGISDRPIIFEAFVSDIDEADAYNMLIEKNMTRTIHDKIKSGIKGIIR